MHKQLWHHGNANEDGKDYRSWVIGPFINPASSLRSTADLKVKWGVHRKGDMKAVWSTDYAHTMAMLVSGLFEIWIGGAQIILTKQGDYLLWPAGSEHTWQALEDSVIVTLRWTEPTS